MSANTAKLVRIGHVSGVHGVKGWLKIHSYTVPRANILTYGSWRLLQGEKACVVRLEDGRGDGGRVTAKLEGIDDRDRAGELIGAEIAVERSQLPECGPDEYYWTDLEGLEVRTPAGTRLGVVDHLLATPGHDVLVVAGERERLIPFVQGAVILSVDLAAQLIIADWPTDE